MEENTTFQKVAIIVLTIVFFTILILSSTNQDITINYTLKDSVEYESNQQYKYDYSFYIGDLYVRNDGFFAKRVDLKTFVACSDENLNTMNVEYTLSDVVRGEVQLFSYDYYKSRIDISPKEEINGKLRINYFVPAIPTTQETVILPDGSKAVKEIYNETNYMTKLYIYEVETYDYNYCSYANTQDAIKIININITKIN